jgi:hypothetical protein
MESCRYSKSAIAISLLLIASLAIVAFAGTAAAQADSEVPGVQWANERSSTTGDGISTVSQNFVTEPTSTDSVAFGPEVERSIRIVNIETDEEVTISPATSSPTVNITEIDISPLRLRDESVIRQITTSDGERIRPYDVTVEGDLETFYESTFAEYVVQVVDSSGSVIAETEESRIRGVEVSAPREEVRYNGSVVRVPRDSAIDPDWEVILTQEDGYITTLDNEAGESFFTFDPAKIAFDEDREFRVEVYPDTEFDEADPYAELRPSEQIISLFGLSVGEPPEDDPEFDDPEEPPEDDPEFDDPEEPPEDDPEFDDPEEPRADGIELDSLKAPSKVTLGEGYTVEATATNTRDEAISTEIIYLFLAPDGLIQTEQVTEVELDPDESTTVEFDISAEQTTEFAFGVGFGHAVVAPGYDELRDRPIEVERGEPRFGGPEEPPVDDPRFDDPEEPPEDDSRFDDPVEPPVDDPWFGGPEEPPEDDPRFDDPEDDPRFDDPEDSRLVEPTAIFEAARDFRSGEIGPATLTDVVAAFRAAESHPIYPREGSSSPPEPDADIESAQSIISSTTAEPGETVTVTAEATFSETVADVQVLQRIGPALPSDNIEITSGGATISAYQSASNGTVVASYGGTDSVTLEYEATIPEDAAVGTTYSLPGGVKIGGSTSPERFSGDTTITVGAADDDASIDSAARSLSETAVLPGEEVDVNLDVAVSGSGSVNVTESISPAPSGANIQAINASGGGTASYNETTGEITAIYEGVDAATLRYTLAVPDDAAGTTYEFTGVDALGDSSLNIEESDITSFTREVSDSTASPGSTVSISVDTTFSSGSDSRSITDEIDPALESENVEVVADDGATISAYQARTGTVTANYGSSKSSAVLEYEITIPDDASAGDTYKISLRGVEDSETISVAGSGDSIAKYANDDGFVGPSGLSDAASDFRAGEISPGTLSEVASAFRSGDPVV